MTDATTLRELADRQQITEQLYRYCRAVDRLDIALGHAVFHEGATADYQDAYRGPARGAIDLICAQHLHLLHHTHQVTNILIQLDGDRAGSEAYYIATLRGKKDGKYIHRELWGRYVDTWSRRADGVWRIDNRIAIRDFDEVREVTQMKDHQTGKRDRTDPSYDVIGDL